MVFYHGLVRGAGIVRWQHEAGPTKQKKRRGREKGGVIAHAGWPLVCKGGRARKGQSNREMGTARTDTSRGNDHGWRLV